MEKRTQKFFIDNNNNIIIGRRRVVTVKRFNAIINSVAIAQDPHADVDDFLFLDGLEHADARTRKKELTKLYNATSSYVKSHELPNNKVYTSDYILLKMDLLRRQKESEQLAQEQDVIKEYEQKHSTGYGLDVERLARLQKDVIKQPILKDGRQYYSTLDTMIIKYKDVLALYQLAFTIAKKKASDFVDPSRYNKVKDDNTKVVTVNGLKKIILLTSNNGFNKKMLALLFNVLKSQSFIYNRLASVNGFTSPDGKKIDADVDAFEDKTIDYDDGLALINETCYALKKFIYDKGLSFMDDKDDAKKVWRHIDNYIYNNSKTHKHKTTNDDGDVIYSVTDISLDIKQGKDDWTTFDNIESVVKEHNRLLTHYELSDAIANIVDMYTPNEKDAAIVKYILQGVHYRTISDIVGVSISTVNYRFDKFKENVRKYETYESIKKLIG